MDGVAPVMPEGRTDIETGDAVRLQVGRNSGSSKQSIFIPGGAIGDAVEDVRAMKSGEGGG